MKIYTKTIKVTSCDECPRAHNWDEQCFMWGTRIRLDDPIPEDCPLPECKEEDEHQHKWSEWTLYVGHIEIRFCGDCEDHQLRRRNDIQ